MPEYTKVLIVDDESLAREIIKNYLKPHTDFSVIAECSNGFEALKKIQELKPDLLFLDIQMPKINGFELLELLDSPPVIVFTTAYDQYAIKAFEVNAADYLLKPFSEERFNEALGKAALRLKNYSDTKISYKNITDQGSGGNEILERIVVKDGSKIIVIPVRSVHWLEAQDDYVMIYSAEGKFLKQQTMKYFEEHLPADFIRIHRSYIARLDRIKSINLLEKDSYQITLQDNTRLPVSRSGYDKLKNILK